MTHKVSNALRTLGRQEVLKVLILDVRQVPFAVRVGEVVRQDSLTLKAEGFVNASFMLSIQIENY